MRLPAEAVLRARYLWTSAGRLYAPGQLVVARGRVVAAGPCRGRRAPPRAILPGLVNAHAHLQIPALRRRETDFLRWVRQVMAATRRLAPAEQVRAAGTALQELLTSGATAVGEIDGTGLSPAALRPTAVAGRCFQEILGYDTGPGAARALVRSRSVPGCRSCPTGLSPHAPYSVSAPLFRAVAARHLPLVIHAAETAEEQEFLRRGSGGFRVLLDELGRLPPGHGVRGRRVPGVGAVAWLDRLGVLGRRTALVHCQHLEPGDAERIRSRGTSIIVCPGTIRYFRRDPPDVAGWLRLGIPVGLGTDSRASNRGLSMCREMSTARGLWPQLAPQTVLSMATAAGARAIARPGLGVLRPGARADFLTVSTVGARSADEVLERFTCGDLEVGATYLLGRRVPAGGPSG